MGVPGLFGYCLKKFKNINLKNIDKQIDYLFIDGNGFIYNAVSQVLNDNITDKLTLYSLICQKTGELLNELVEKLNPLNVYLAFDGVAPMAKIIQQRSRRYKTKLEDDFKQQLNIKYGIKTPEYNKFWSNILITPGTEFMNYLDNYFKSFSFKSVSFIFDGSNNIGEGEHKILKYIRNNDFTDKIIVIHGLDGDLIFLSMLLNNVSEIYIFRQQNKNKSNETIDSFLDIKSLKSNFLNYFQSVSSDIKFTMSDNNIVDFIFICFMIGNDFLPCQKFINIYQNGLDILINNYIETLKSYTGLIKIKENKQIEINVLAFYKFIQLCTLSEYEEYKYQKETHYKSYYFRALKNKKTYDNLSGYEKELYGYQNILSIDNFLPLQNNFDDYRFEFYNHYFKTTDQKEVINNCCYEYLKMMKWNIEYYLFGPTDWLFSYNFPVSPLFFNILEFLTNYTFNFNNIKQVKNNCVSSEIQLNICIPDCYLEKYNISNKKIKLKNITLDTKDKIFVYQGHLFF